MEEEQSSLGAPEEPREELDATRSRAEVCARNLKRDLNRF